jgi:hypothetical protein
VCEKEGHLISVFRLKAFLHIYIYILVDDYLIFYLTFLLKMNLSVRFQIFDVLMV